MALLIRSLFRQAGIQDAMKETTDEATDQLKLWEEFGQHLDEGVALVNERGNIEYVNSAFASLTGWPNRSAFHQQLDSVVTLQDDQAREAKIPETTTSDTFYCIGQDGSRTPVHAVKRPLQRPVGYLMVILQDATPENAEKELRHRLINLSSFELRAPVTAMKGYASMLIEGDAGKISQEQQGYVQPILESTENLLTLINDMAQVEELSTKKHQAKKQEVEPAEFLAQLSSRLSDVATKADRSLTVSPATTLAKIAIDPEQISRLLVMLTNTAVRTANPKTAVVMSIEESPRTIDIHLTNQGEPLPKQSQANVFDYVGGRGLDEGIGFYVAKQIIEAHHAFVTVNTRPDGNVFIVSLPKLAPPAPVVADSVDDTESALASDATETTTISEESAPGSEPTSPETSPSEDVPVSKETQPPSETAGAPVTGSPDTNAAPPPVDGVTPPTDTR